MKRCSKCGIKKSVKEFYYNKLMKDKLAFWCKKCTAAYTKKYQKLYPKKILAAKIKYKKRMKRLGLFNRGKRKEQQARWLKKNKHKRKTHNAVFLAIKKGKLKKPRICSNCKHKVKYIFAHHKDYKKPLEVEWLCGRCHYEIHCKIVR